VNKIFALIDKWINKIPEHVKDLIQKGSYGAFALLALLAIMYGITEGEKGAKPSGMPIAGKTNDLFYLDELKEENRKKQRLIEDVEIDPGSFSSQKKILFEKMGKETEGHLMGERDSLIEEINPMREKSESALYLNEEPLFPDNKPKESLVIQEEISEFLIAPYKDDKNLNKSDEKINNTNNNNSFQDKIINPQNYKKNKEKDLSFIE